MSDWMSTMVAMQRDLIKAQTAQFDAAQKLIDGGRQWTRMQEAGQKAVEANLAAWKQWVGLWGWK